MNFIELPDVIIFIKEALGEPQFDHKLSTTLTALCSFVVIFHIAKIAITNLLRAGESFSFDELRKPAFILLAIAAWPYADLFIRTIASEAITGYVYEKQKKVDDKNTAIFNSMTTAREKLKEALKDRESQSLGELGVMESIKIHIKYLDDRMMETVYSGVYGFLRLVDSLLFIGFYIVAFIWLKIVGLGGAIAFTISLLTGGWSGFINWAKTYISVSLWVPVAGYVMGLVNSIGVKIIEQVSIGMDRASSYSPGMTFMSISLQFGNILITSIVISLVLLACKLLLLAKVPQMITGWIGGGSSASGGFSAAFVPISVAKNTASVATTAAVSGTMGPIAGGATPGGFRKKDNENG